MMNEIIQLGYPSYHRDNASKVLDDVTINDKGWTAGIQGLKDLVSGAQVVGAKANGTQGLDTEDLGAQGLGAQGLGPQDLAAKGLGAQILGAKGLGAQSLGAQDLSALAQKLGVLGLGPRGLGVQGLGTQGLGAKDNGSQGLGAEDLGAQGPGHGVQSETLGSMKTTTPDNLIEIVEKSYLEFSETIFNQQGTKTYKVSEETTNEVIENHKNFYQFQDVQDPSPQSPVEKILCAHGPVNIKGKISCKTPGCKIALHKAIGPLPKNFKGPMILPSIWHAENNALSILENKKISQELMEAKKTILNHHKEKLFCCMVEEKALQMKKAELEKFQMNLWSTQADFDKLERENLFLLDMINLKDEENIEIKREFQNLKTKMAKKDSSSNSDNLSKIANLRQELQSVYDVNENLANEVMQLREKKEIAKKVGKVLDFDSGDVYFKQHKDLELKMAKLREELHCANEARGYFEIEEFNRLNENSFLQKQANEVTAFMESEIQLLIGTVMDQSEELDELKQKEIDQQSTIDQQSEEIERLQTQVENLLNTKYYCSNLPNLELMENPEYSNATPIEVKEDHHEKSSTKVEQNSSESNIESNQNNVKENLLEKFEHIAQNNDNIAENGDNSEEFSVLNLSDIEKTDSANEEFDFIEIPKENNESQDLKNECENEKVMWVSDKMLSQLKEIEKIEKKRYDEHFLLNRNPLLDLLKAASCKKLKK